MREERQHFVADLRIVGRLARQPARHVARRMAIQRRLEEVADALTLAGRHAGDPLRSR
jgi:hypothetical protein